ncbi:hypothetical protein [Streptomyces sp. 8N616]|uniref:hypothetical protein n=1 Tax=Streptomyces sp. 8N616 TaxID=3457414 RepID=UPI003FD40BB1
MAEAERAPEQRRRVLRPTRVIPAPQPLEPGRAGTAAVIEGEVLRPGRARGGAGRGYGRPYRRGYGRPYGRDYGRPYGRAYGRRRAAEAVMVSAVAVASALLLVLPEPQGPSDVAAAPVRGAGSSAPQAASPTTGEGRTAARRAPRDARRAAQVGSASDRAAGRGGADVGRVPVRWTTGTPSDSRPRPRLASLTRWPSAMSARAATRRPATLRRMAALRAGILTRPPYMGRAGGEHRTRGTAARQEHADEAEDD